MTHISGLRSRYNAIPNDAQDGHLGRVPIHAAEQLTLRRIELGLPPRCVDSSDSKRSGRPEHLTLPAAVDARSARLRAASGEPREARALLEPASNRASAVAVAPSFCRSVIPRSPLELAVGAISEYPLAMPTRPQPASRHHDAAHETVQPSCSKALR